MPSIAPFRVGYLHPRRGRAGRETAASRAWREIFGADSIRATGGSLTFPTTRFSVPPVLRARPGASSRCLLGAVRGFGYSIV